LETAEELYPITVKGCDSDKTLAAVPDGDNQWLLGLTDNLPPSLNPLPGKEKSIGVRGSEESVPLIFK
jgi:hypothetical protein